MKEFFDWDEGCYEKVTYSNVAQEKNEESKRIPQDALEKETNGIELYEPDEKGWRYGAKKVRYSEEIEDELVSIMIKYLENHDTYKLLELVVSAVATKEQ